MSGDNENVSPLGIDVRMDRRKLKSGEEQAGLLVVDVESGGPAAKAGLKGNHHRVKTAVEVASIAGALFFPPAMMLVPVLESTRAGESYDLIVGVDGNRVTDLLDFEDCLRDLRPGEIVYLSIVRDG
ncbi:MAG: PDZ domain-containing protein, partial [Candidatus Binataceae bacterium]